MHVCFKILGSNTAHTFGFSAPTRAMGQEQSGEAAGDEENGGNVFRPGDVARLSHWLGRVSRLRTVRFAKPKLRKAKLGKPKHPQMAI